MSLWRYSAEKPTIPKVTVDFGLGLSIPFVVLTSNLLSMLMDRYPLIIMLGAAILGKVGGEMLITDPFTVDLLQPSATTRYLVEAGFAGGVIIVGKLLIRIRNGKKERELVRIPERSI